MRYKMPSSCNPRCWWALSRISPGSRYKMTSPRPPGGCNNWGAIFCMVPRISQEVSRMHKRPLSLARLRTVPHQFSWVDQRLVRERSIDQLSPEACALSLFLGSSPSLRPEVELDNKGLRAVVDKRRIPRNILENKSP